jgi:hypothetical protein
MEFGTDHVHVDPSALYHVKRLGAGRIQEPVDTRRVHPVDRWVGGAIGEGPKDPTRRRAEEGLYRMLHQSLPITLRIPQMLRVCVCVCVIHVQPFHAALTATSKEHFTLETILDKSAPLSGSHVID